MPVFASLCTSDFSAAVIAIELVSVNSKQRFGFVHLSHVSLFAWHIQDSASSVKVTIASGVRGNVGNVGKGI